MILLEIEGEAEYHVGGGVGVVLHGEECGGCRGLVDVPLQSILIAIDAMRFATKSV